MICLTYRVAYRNIIYLLLYTTTFPVWCKRCNSFEGRDGNSYRNVRKIHIEDCSLFVSWYNECMFTMDGRCHKIRFKAFRYGTIRYIAHKCLKEHSQSMINSFILLLEELRIPITYYFSK